MVLARDFDKSPRFDQKLVAKNCLPQSEKFRNEVKEFGTILLPDFGFYQSKLLLFDVDEFQVNQKVLTPLSMDMLRRIFNGFGDRLIRQRLIKGKKDNKPQDGAEGSSEQTTDKGSNWVWNRKEEQKQDQGGWKKKEGWVPSGCFTRRNSMRLKGENAKDFGPTTEKDGQDCNCNVEQRVPEMITGMESYQGKAVQYWDHISECEA
ncbi:hypothetical protein Tco_0866135 [Tanacetum coccineum]